MTVDYNVVCGYSNRLWEDLGDGHYHLAERCGPTIYHIGKVDSRGLKKWKSGADVSDITIIYEED